MRNILPVILPVIVGVVFAVYVGGVVIELLNTVNNTLISIN